MELTIEDLEIGKCYKYNDLIQLVLNDEQLDYREFGNDVIGQFTLQTDDENMTYSFILDGTIGNDYLMKFVNKA